MSLFKNTLKILSTVVAVLSIFFEICHAGSNTDTVIQNARIGDVSDTENKTEPKHNNTNVKILVGYHKPATLLKSDVFVPIHLGRAVAMQESKDGKISDNNYNWLLKNTIGDDTGDNISHLNRYYCEMTGMYWAWKNYDKLGNPDYIGFMHYRRHLNFNTRDNLSGNVWGLIEVPFLNEEYIKNFCLTDAEVNSYVKDYDVVVARKALLDTTTKTPYNHYKNSAYWLHIEDYDIALKILKEKYPEFAEIADRYNRSNVAYFTHLFIMKKDIFNKYCTWLFDILNECQKRIDISKYNQMEARVFGYISEWLSGIYITYLYAKGYKISELPRSQIINTDVYESDLQPIFQDNSINVCLATDHNYLLPTMVTLKSLICHSSKQNDYDIIVFEEGLSDQDKVDVTRLIEGLPNFSIRFVNVLPWRDRIFKQELFESGHIKKSSYNRLLTPFILNNYKKAVYIDTDIVLQRDIADLYNVDLLGKPLGAILDIELNRWYFADRFMKDYIDKINLAPESYFNAGVLLMDLDRIRKDSLDRKSTEILREVKRPQFWDQDILNICYKGNVTFLDPKWNFESHIPFWNPNYREQLPEEYLKTYDETSKNPWIIHYAGAVKPWQSEEVPYANVWWEYAKMITNVLVQRCMAR